MSVDKIVAKYGACAAMREVTPAETGISALSLNSAALTFGKAIDIGGWNQLQICLAVTGGVTATFDTVIQLFDSTGASLIGDFIVVTGTVLPAVANCFFMWATSFGVVTRIGYSATSATVLPVVFPTQGTINTDSAVIRIASFIKVGINVTVAGASTMNGTVLVAA